MGSCNADSVVIDDLDDAGGTPIFRKLPLTKNGQPQNLGFRSLECPFQVPKIYMI